jgi:hypothetical protein
MASYTLKGKWYPDGPATQGRFNPTSWADNRSRSTWTENITRADKARHEAFVRNRLMKNYPHLSLEDVEYYLQRELSQRG